MSSLGCDGVGSVDSVGMLHPRSNGTKREHQAILGGTGLMHSVELFAGAGGLGIGTDRAGFKPKAVIEFNRHCRDTLEWNRENRQSDVRDWPKVACLDVRDFDYSKLCGNVALVSGGPPCQPFSLGGRHQAFSDKRDMFPEAVRALRELRPAAFIFENVKGLTRPRFHNYYQYITLQMKHPELVARVDEDWGDHLRRLEQHELSGNREGLHYRIVDEVLNASNYGVPQRRERVFFVGFRRDLTVDWAFPDETHSQDALLWSQRKGGEYWEQHGLLDGWKDLPARSAARQTKLTELPRKNSWRTVRDALADLPAPAHANANSNVHLNHVLQPGARSYPGHTGSHLDEPGKTLKAGVHGVPGGENMLLDPRTRKVRYFSVRECARLQGFPDDFAFLGCWSEAMRQLGNAVPVTLAEIIAKSVMEALSLAVANKND